MELVPIKVKIGLRSNGHADHPNWTQLPMISSDQQVRQYAPFGWMYDKSCGHKEDGVDSPIGMQWGFLLVTREFADEALAVYPELITELTEAEFKIAYENKVTAHIPDNKYDIQTLQGLQIELDLKEKLNQDTTNIKVKIAKAIDPDDVEPGVEKNKDKYWDDYKADKLVTIK